MSLLIKGDLDTLAQYKNGNVSAKYNNKKHKVFFELVCNEFNLKDCINFAKQSSNVLFINYEGLTDSEDYLSLNSSDVNICITSELGNNITEDDIEFRLNETPQGVVPVIILPESFTDLHLIYKLCKKYDRVRFVGGTLFPIEDVRLGFVPDTSYSKRDIKDNYINEFDYSPLIDVDLVDVELSVSAKKATGTDKKKSSSSSTKKKPSLNFASLRPQAKFDL